MTRKHSLTDQIRKVIDASEKSRYQIAKETGIDEATLSRFIHGKGGLSMEGLDAIGKYLGLHIVTDKPKAKKGE
jgi:transcriptional regulator with XRE-family HTH domain